MLNRFILCAAVILLSCSSTLANIGHCGGHSIGRFTTIGQDQDFSIGGFNMVKRVGGYGRAESENAVTVGQCQAAHSAGSAALQQQVGKIAQNASVSGIGGTTKVLQDASVEGLQDQTIKGRRHGLRAQDQSLNVELDNVLRKTGGIGKAQGTQSFVGRQSQIQITPGGIGVNTQSVEAEQSAKIAGSPCSTVIVNNSLDVQMGQSQTISTAPSKPSPPPPPPCGK